MNVFAKYTDAETYAKIVDYASVSEMWKHSVLEYANALAIVDNGENITYAQLEEEVAQMRGYLFSQGIKKGDNVGVFIPNSAAFVKAFLAITTIGAVAVLLPPQLDEMTVFGCSMKFALNALVNAVVIFDKSKSTSFPSLFFT